MFQKQTTKYMFIMLYLIYDTLKGLIVIDKNVIYVIQK